MQNKSLFVIVFIFKFQTQNLMSHDTVNSNSFGDNNQSDLKPFHI